MEEEEIVKVYQAIRKHGDSFWNDTDELSGWNGYLFEDILMCLEKDGLDLRLVQKDEQTKKE